MRGTGYFSFETNSYEKVTDLEEIPMWLPDSRRISFTHENKAFIVDVETKKMREILPRPSEKISTAAVSRRSEEHTSELQSRRYLDFFPTRRSSDLCSAQVIFRLKLILTKKSLTGKKSQCVCPTAAVSALRTKTRRLLLMWKQKKCEKFSRVHRKKSAPLPSAADRKSTRLNSSHADI